jgi:hypothetical protein
MYFENPTRLESTTDDIDYGVDFIGSKGRTKFICQSKYRGLNSPIPTYSELANTYTQGNIHFNIKPKPQSIILITNSKEVSPNIDKIFGDIVRVISFDEINSKYNNEFREYMIKNVPLLKEFVSVKVEI